MENALSFKVFICGYILFYSNTQKHETLLSWRLTRETGTACCHMKSKMFLLDNSKTKSDFCGATVFVVAVFGLQSCEQLLTIFDLETAIFFMLQTESVRCEPNFAMTANQKLGHHLILRKVGQTCEQLVRNFANRIGPCTVKHVLSKYDS